MLLRALSESYKSGTPEPLMRVLPNVYTICLNIILKLQLLAWGDLNGNRLSLYIFRPWRHLPE